MRHDAAVRMQYRAGMRLPAAVLLAVALVSTLGAHSRTAAPGLRLAADTDSSLRVESGPPASRPTALTFARGSTIRASLAKSPAGPTFGQPTIAGVAGWGFEADLRLDPSNTNRLYTSSPDSGGSDTSWIWRSLDGGKTFKWVPA